MKFLLAAALALAAPALAQQNQPATPPPKSRAPSIEDFVRSLSKPDAPVEVFTEEELRSMSAPPLADQFQRKPTRPGDGRLNRKPYTGGGELYPVTPTAAPHPQAPTIVVTGYLFTQNTGEFSVADFTRCLSRGSEPAPVDCSNPLGPACPANAAGDRDAQGNPCQSLQSDRRVIAIPEKSL